MKSIKNKLFMGILFILSIFMIGIIIYGFSFKEYFQKEKLKDMKEIILEVEENFDENSIEFMEKFISNLSDKYNVQIDIQNRNNGKVVCATNSSGKNTMNGGGGQHRFEVTENLGIKDDIIKEIIHDNSTGTNFLTSIKYIDNEKYQILIRTPINIMEDAVVKSITLLMIIFIPITIIILALTGLFSKKFTNPIIKITEKTSKIEKLDFSDDLNIKGSDEITILAKSVNNLSSTIESTLEELNDKNLSLKKFIDKEKENEVLRREFVSSVSHELKSPIAVISGYAQALEAGIISNEEDKSYYIGVINEEAERMQIIVNDLLDLYKLESNTFKLDVKEFSLDILMKRIIKKNDLRFAENNIKLITNIEAVNIIGDEIRIEQAIQNYINNAISHVDDKKVLEVNLVNKDNTAIISVYNSGKNIEEENINRIWQGFVRIDKVRNYKEKRVGLGLAIVKQIVRLHNGTYGIINKENGVEFYIKLSNLLNKY
ncbi:HAMP domain-containing sensor histidine kinase [Clostridioides difficile]